MTAAAAGGAHAPADGAAPRGPDWTAVGAVGTAAGVIATVAFFGANVVMARRRRTDEQAARIRDDLRAFRVAADELTGLLSEGSAIVGAAWAARQALAAALPPAADGRAVRAALRAPGTGLSVAVAGWERSGFADALRAATDRMREAGRRLTGHFSLLSAAGELAVRIRDDVRQTYLRLAAEPALTQAFLDDAASIGDGARVLDAYNAHLHGNLAGYVLARYAPALRALRALIEVATASLPRMAAARLVEMASARPGAAAAGGTVTGEIRAGLRPLSRILNADLVRRMEALVDAIEDGLREESARARLAASARVG